ncbi:MAG TPA: hypothetical protein ENK32_11470 [Anaerolineae bacterium]|nr:hypothetical protein [Anaerolineae bacterium]
MPRYRKLQLIFGVIFIASVFFVVLVILMLLGSQFTAAPEQSDEVTITAEPPLVATVTATSVTGGSESIAPPPEAVAATVAALQTEQMAVSTAVAQLSATVAAHDEALSPPEDSDNGWLTQRNVALLGALLTPLIALAGFISSTMLQWRDQKLEEETINVELRQKKEKLELELLELERERKQLELDKARREQNS